MKAFSIVDESFDPGISLSYFLSIQITLDGFSFCTLDPVKNKYIQMQHIRLDSKLPLVPQVEECFNTIEKLNLPYKKSMVLIPTHISTLVPTPLYNPDDKLQWLSFCHHLPENASVRANKIKLADAINVFVLDEGLEKLLKRQFPDPLIFQQHTPIIEGNLTTNMINSGQTVIAINFENDYFDLMAFQNNNLKLCNSFPIKSDNDFIYFTLFTYEQLKLNPLSTEMIMYGRHPHFQQLSETLSKYIKKVKQNYMPHHFQYSHQFRTLSSTAFYNMLTLPVCV